MSREARRQTLFYVLVLAVAFPAVAYTLGVAGWAAGLAIGPALPVAALALCAIGVAALAGRREAAAVAVALLLFGAFFALALAVSSSGVDVFFDSRSYHLPAVIALAQGWNPIHDPQLCDWSAVFCLPTGRLIDHYPKAPWIVSASFYAATGSFESGKAGQWITALAAAIATLRLLRGLPFASRVPPLALTVALTLNPIVIKQFGSAYVDGWLASGLLLHAALLGDFVVRGRRSSLVLAAVHLPFLLNLKFTALPFAALIGITALALAWQLRRRCVAPMLGLSLPAAAAGVLLLGFHPYVTNTIETGNPFEAVVRRDGGDLFAKIVSPSFLERDRISRFVVAQTSRARGEDHREPEWRAPFTAWRTTADVDDRFGGFGEPFAAAVVLALVALPLVGEKILFTVLAGLVASIFVTEAAWWARLTPQAWWLPLVVAAACWLPGRPRSARVLGGLCAAVLTYVIVATIAVSGLHAMRSRARLSTALEQLEAHPAVVVPDRDFGVMRAAFALTLRQRLRDAGHPIRVSPRPPRPCVMETVVSAGASLCFQDRRKP